MREKRYEILGNSLLVADNECVGVCNVFSLFECIDLLNQQDKEIKKLTTELENYKLCKCVNCSNEYEYGLETSIKELEEENQQLKQTHKQLIINVLENIMSLCRNGISDYYSLNYVCTIIENKIKKLKGETI